MALEGCEVPLSTARGFHRGIGLVDADKADGIGDGDAVVSPG
jgi:hypothetical protein